ncbi:hypothetical protein BU23DRAFT_469990 [Bimuria novae-zelandiae CBS 107.79]|uniref:Uncharacterized protein n=1 Tax=Bimuria novae-zelandiae CBS 107.79 TaxID=1447943 RepID=A0A6A5V579_9PLEO|nr:hypothetical protein BU23DRAFT_469990 [Bimuria novae-zelandiae CBS 107.79]
MSGVLNSIQSVLGKLGTTFISILDRIIPPEKRAEMLNKLKGFAINNPKLAAFLSTQIVLTGIPLILFITFAITVFVFSLIVALLIGLLAAVLFTLFMVCVALLVVLPTIFMTTFTATFLFLWGLGGYYILKYNEGETPAPDGTTIGDKINNLSGGRMGWLTEGVKKKQEDIRTDVDQTPKMHGGEHDDSDGKSSGRAPRKLAEKPKDSTNESNGGVQKRPMKSAGGAENAAHKVNEKTESD